MLLYAPFEVPDEQATSAFLTAGRGRSASWSGQGGRLAAGAVVLAEAVHRIDRARYAWPVGRTRLQKLAYFLTACGVPTGLAFVEGSYGPFSQGLAPMLRQLVNNGVLAEVRLGPMHAVKPGVAFEDARAHHRRAVEQHEQAIARVADLLARLDTRHTELAASVHFAAGTLRSQLGRDPTEREVLEKVLGWKQRHPQP